MIGGFLVASNEGYRTAWSRGYRTAWSGGFHAAWTGERTAQPKAGPLPLIELLESFDDRSASFRSS